jgi:hypothetical protein
MNKDKNGHENGLKYGHGHGHGDGADIDTDTDTKMDTDMDMDINMDRGYVLVHVRGGVRVRVHICSCVRIMSVSEFMFVNMCEIFRAYHISTGNFNLLSALAKISFQRLELPHF